MKQLLLLRHAKSSWDNPGLRDFDRPLNKRGLRDAPRMADRLLAHTVAPDLVLSSTAERARATATLFHERMQLEPGQMVAIDAMYLASANELVAVLREYGSGASVMLVAHNPGMTDLVNWIGDQAIDNLPTCGLAGISIEVDTWSALPAVSAASRFGTAVGRTLFIDYPKKVA